MRPLMRPDPLTANLFDVIGYRRSHDVWDDDCDCGRPPAARHDLLCSVTPIYAGMCADFGLPRVDMPLDAIRVMSMPLRPPLPPDCICEPADPGFYSGTTMPDCPIHAESVLGKRL